MILMSVFSSTLSSLAISNASTENLTKFSSLFAKWNRSINLSAATTADEINEHIRDSLYVVPHLRGRGRVLDVGSGGGFPVVVAAICLPSCSFTALEPVHKKHAFLRTAARELGLTNLDARAERLEDHAERDYNAAMSRATFDLDRWLRSALERVVPGGVVLGFEANRREDLTVPIERHAYDLAGKTRAIVVAVRPG